VKQIVLDTETTGLNAKLGDRIIEIGCVELASRRVSERTFQAYLNPEREVDLGATRVHGLTREDLAAKPKFAEVAPQFLDFIRGAELLIHNAEFDVDFLDMELERCGLGKVQDYAARITDTLLSAKELHPGKRNSLDALCERYFIDNSRRTLHGALADALLLAECYLAMTRGQESLMMELESPAAVAGAAAGIILDVSKLIVLQPTAEELASHEQYLDALEKEAKGPSLWRRILNSA
jgi:DNA polymerase-3 subunit epsilon